MISLPGKVGRLILRGWSTVAGIPRRTVDWSGRRPRAAGVLAGALAVVLLAGTAGFTALYLQQATVKQARVDATEAAKKAVPTLLSYDHKTLAEEIDSRADLLAGSFKADYATLLRDNVLPAAQASALITTSMVNGAGVEAEDGPDHVTLLMFVNQSTGAEGQAPAKAGSRISVTMEHSDDDRWLISGLKPV